MKRLGAVMGFWRIVAVVVFIAGIWATVVRFSQGLGAATNLSDEFPWGIWIGFDLLVGVALAAGGFTITATVHIFNLERFRPITRSTVLTAFMGYLLVILALLFDLGRPDHIWHPLIMWNTHSALFEVAWCVMLYTAVLALEFSPMLLERLKLAKPARIIRGFSVPLVLIGVLLSTLHQSSLGTLFVIVPEKMFGLWYTPMLPILFFMSAIAAGLAMVIVESYLSARAFDRRLEQDLLQDLWPVEILLAWILCTIDQQSQVRHLGAEKFLGKLHQQPIQKLETKLGPQNSQDSVHQGRIPAAKMMIQDSLVGIIQQRESRNLASGGPRFRRPGGPLLELQLVPEMAGLEDAGHWHFASRQRQPLGGPRALPKRP